MLTGKGQECPNCHAQNEINAKFCIKCGNPLSVSTGGGPYVGENVSTNGGDFVGGNQKKSGTNRSVVVIDSSGDRTTKLKNPVFITQKEDSSLPIIAILVVLALIGIIAIVSITMLGIIPFN